MDFDQATFVSPFLMDIHEKFAAIAARKCTLIEYSNRAYEYSKTEIFTLKFLLEDKSAVTFSVERPLKEIAHDKFPTDQF